MWNFSYTIPSILILCIFLCYFFAWPRLPIRINRTFVALLLTQILVVLTDLVSSTMDSSPELFSTAGLYFWNMAFFVLFLLRIFLFFDFSLDVLDMRPAKYSPLWWLYTLVLGICEAVTLSSVFTGAVFSIDESGYHRGVLYQVLYICFFFYLFISLVLLFSRRREVDRAAFLGVTGYNVILFVGNIVRILMPHYLVMNTFCLMAIIIIYLSFENPIHYTSEGGPAFNFSAFHVLLKELLEEQKPFRILGFTLKNYADERVIYGSVQMRQGISLITRYLVTVLPSYQVFYLRSGCFVILGDGSMDWDRIRQSLYSRFHQPWNADGADLYLDAAFVQVDSQSGLGSADRIINNLLASFDQLSQSVDSEDKALSLEAVGEIDQLVEVKRAMEKAIEEDNVEIYLQPLVDAKTRRPVAAEALARIRNASGELIPPNVFIPIAEKNGQIIRMGTQVFEKACRFISSSHLENMGISWINVNLSPIQCMKRDLYEEFRQIMEDYQVDPQSIHLEITEQSMIDFSFFREQMETLRHNGFRLVLDDYGSGYSNLTRVKRYPFFSIKLDMDVVWDYFHDRDELLPTMVRTFKQMGYTITAEGIESAEMADALTELGCDYLQGFYFSRPMPLEEFSRQYQISA